MAQPSPEIRQRLAQLRAEAMIRAERDAQRQRAIQNAEKIAGQPVALPTDKKAEGGLAEFLKDSKVKHRVYHGTADDFSEFNYDPMKAIGVWLAKDPEIASGYSDIAKRTGKNPSVMPLHVSLKNPANRAQYLAARKQAEEHSDKHGYADHNKRHREILQSQGFDGVDLGDVYIAFHPHQIKSATGNRGTYDPNDPDITKAKGGVVSLLRKHGQGVPTELEAMRRMSNGHRIFVVHEQDETPKEIKSVQELAGYAPDQIYTLAPQHKAHGGQVNQDMMRLAIGGQGPRNWLKGTVEKVTEPLKVTGGMHPDEMAKQQKLIEDATAHGTSDLLQRGLDFAIRQMKDNIERAQKPNAINAWIERNLANYIRKQIGSPNDPVRKLAEEGILHFDPDTVPIIGGHETAHEHAESRRKMLGGQKMAKGPLAQAWEDAVDSRLEPNSIEDIWSMPELFRDQVEPWMQKADPKSYVLEPYAFDELGFDHIVDILKQDLASGRIRPEQLNKVSIEQAVRRAHEVNMANKKAMEEASLKATEGMPVHKDYGNGFKWVELAMPEMPKELPEGWTMKESKAGLLRASKPNPVDPHHDITTLGNDLPDLIKNIYSRHPETPGNPYEKLKDALAYESDVMGHCVGGERLPDGTRTGGYANDVKAGKSRIFSLRDEKNEPHVTIEVEPYGAHNQDVIFRNMIDKLGRDPTMDDFQAALNEKPPKIKQIKGKGNAKPKKDYIPFVQDFVKSGNWADVGELNNTDLRKIGNKYLSDDELDALSKQHLGTVINNPARYYSDMKRKDPSAISEADRNFINALEQYGNQPQMADGGEVDAEAVFMAKGGKVSSEPKKTVKAYKLFRVDERHPGKLFPLFVNANQPVEMNKWVDAEVGPQTDKGKVKSKLGPLAYRPGWHSGDLPVATHIGAGGAPPTHRPKNHAWAEVEVPDDVDWQTEANKRGTNAQGKLVPVKAHITDQIPKGGHYRYKTNPNMTGNWLISGSMKVNKVLSHAEVERINKKAGVSDLPRNETFNKKDFGFKHGGEVDAESAFFPKSKE